MLDQLIITGTSGAIIIFMIMGLGKIIKISKAIKAGNDYKNATKSVLGKSIIAWLSAIFSLLFILMIVFGVIISIIFS